MTMTQRQILKAALAAVALLTAAPSIAAEQALELGVLNCKAVPGTRLNLIVRSTVDVTCTFKHESGEERYRGETGISLGLDLSFRKNEKFAFSVISTAKKYLPHALAGKYIGAKLVASLGVGLGAAALVGGSADSFGLNPLALETNEGFGLAGGIGFLYIEADK